ncbi:hypothetical protein BDP27DRAFT_1449988 [Rhodocollybia butyracea]|uniref:Uncharacterized protein n=1 Tax=Rhodocollybia butyracea TaxID=206335 RepID=A0A9P5PQ50_9AGAR|nr:hypothetical protein BDP27DRAFT_1449988 [Rhodocollybia butyracea]
MRLLGYADHSRQFVDTLQTHITRSRGLPLTIEVLILSDDPVISAEAVGLFFYLTNRHIRRLRIQASAEAIVKLVNVELPLLEELEILHADDSAITLLMDKAPRLYSLHTHFALPRVRNTVTISLDIYMCFGAVSRICDLFPNLQSLCLREPSSKILRESGQSCITSIPRIWTTITSLTFHLRQKRFRTRYIRSIFNSLYLPNLSSLHVEHPHESPDLNPDLTLPSVLTLLIRKSSCTLERLILRRVPLEVNGVIQLLDHVPSLLELEIDDINLISSPFLSLFIKHLRSRSPVLVPSLQRLSMIVTTATFDELALADMVEHRCASSLKSVNIQFPNRRSSLRLSRRLEDIGHQGDVTISWYKELLQLNPLDYQSVTKYGPMAFVVGFGVILLFNLHTFRFRR